MTKVSYSVIIQYHHLFYEHIQTKYGNILLEFHIPLDTYHFFPKKSQDKSICWYNVDNQL